MNTPHGEEENEQHKKQWLNISLFFNYNLQNDDGKTSFRAPS